jgi:fatty-acyl-CoA synthase
MGQGAGIYARDLDPNAANTAPLSPLGFLARSAQVYPDKIAVIDGARRFTYRDFHARCRRLASALARRGIGPGDTVSVIAPNGPALLEAHYGVPATGAVLNAVNTRLDPATLALILRHGEAKLLIADRELSHVVAPALASLDAPPPIVDIDPPGVNAGELLGQMDYEALLETGDSDFPWQPPQNEHQAIALSYTSGTAGDPKGVVYSHRGAYLNALGNALSLRLGPESVYLWTLPMFHCSGWSYTWAVTAVGGTHLCLRRLDPAEVYRLIAEHGVTHLCAAPVVLGMLAHAPPEAKRRFDKTVEVATGGAAPPSAIIEEMERAGFRITHLYGLTESYGPALICAWQQEWDGLDLTERARRMARQGVRSITLEDMMVADPATMREVAWDGQAMGEIMLRGNTVMKGYLKNPTASARDFAGGWLHTGDLAVRHPDGYVEVKDRSKDIIISGGENISSLEVEEVLYRHPSVLEAAVVARTDPVWGESPCAFVALRPEDEGRITAEALIAWCRDRMAHFKAPRSIVFCELPKTSTGKVRKTVLRERAKALGA